MEQYVKFNPRILEMDQQPETIKIASKLKLAVTCGFIGSAAQYQNLLLSASSQLLGLHARVQELERDLNGAKRLVSKIWNQHTEARRTIEEGTGAWMVFGQDVETSVSAQRVTQAADHIEQPLEMVAAPVVLPEPEAEVVECRGDCPFQDGTNNEISVHLPVGTKLYTEQQVRELLAAHGITQGKAQQRQGGTTMAINTGAERASIRAKEETKQKAMGEHAFNLIKNEFLALEKASPGILKREASLWGNDFGLRLLGIAYNTAKGS